MKYPSSLGITQKPAATASTGTAAAVQQGLQYTISQKPPEIIYKVQASDIEAKKPPTAINNSFLKSLKPVVKVESLPPTTIKRVKLRADQFGKIAMSSLPAELPSQPLETQERAENFLIYSVGRLEKLNTPK